MPGKTGTISAKFNSSGKMGMQSKVLTIESNSMSGNAMVELVGDVTAATTTATASEVKGSEASEKETKVKAKSGDVKVKTKRKAS